MNFELLIVSFLLWSAAIPAASYASLFINVQLSINDSEFNLSSIIPLINKHLLSVKSELVIFAPDL